MPSHSCPSPQNTCSINSSSISKARGRKFKPNKILHNLRSPFRRPPLSWRQSRAKKRRPTCSSLSVENRVPNPTSKNSMFICIQQQQRKVVANDVLTRRSTQANTTTCVFCCGGTSVLFGQYEMVALKATTLLNSDTWPHLKASLLQTWNSTDANSSSSNSRAAR